MQTIVELRKVGKDDVLSVGAKAAALGELIRAGMNVPAGLALTTAAYHAGLERLQPRIQARIREEVLQDPAEIETAAEEVRQWIEQEPWPPQLDSDLRAALAPWTGGAETAGFAARTSLPSDELATAFGSGVQRAALGLVGIEAIERGVARGWGALWTSRSMYYRFRKHISQFGVALGIVIQPMVPAESAGILFTQNPLNGENEELQIDSIWGLGAPLAQARVRPDRFLVRKADLSITGQSIEEKPVELVVAGSGQVEQRAVDQNRVEAPSLSEAQVLELARLGRLVEELFGEPQSIEWAQSGGAIYVLQARPLAVRKS